MTKSTYAHTMHSIPLILGNAMESNEDVVMIPRLNALVRANRFAQSNLGGHTEGGLQSTIRNQALAINHLLAGMTYSFLYLPAVENLCYAAIPGVFDTLTRRTNSV